MAWRESIEIPPVSHQNPIPAASKVGNTVYTSMIAGRDPVTGATPDSAAEQAQNVFTNLGNILKNAGARPGDVAHVRVWIKEGSVREHVNNAWVAMFPDEHSRPARHTTVVPDLGGLVQIEAVAIIQDA